MKRLPTLVLLAALLPCAWIAPAPAQPSRPAADLTLAQAERMASDLKYGMSADEVRKLLGKPRRTALRPNGLSTTAPWQGNLRWTYNWPGSSFQGTSLQIEFAAKTPEEWYVNSWEWGSY